MNQKIHNYDKELVKLITNSIFKDRITSIQELKDRAYQNDLIEEDVENIFRILLFDEFVRQENTPFSENGYLINDSKIYELEREDLI
ncbi:hypothetical protein [Mammaliicoccus sciuri]|uniref:hypothetical protein n=1 Tax=Mammaliicoccus sciuri TaxID=1296 RepID=UPI001C1E7E3B|nr:hypothetical protein [Mammaliicoccus sciuri]MBU6089435.1 hypothetical protein [Mammaliicoccus sciuri]MBW3109850.1 hypothetical protein [Mammaliicoccus sciuri]